MKKLVAISALAMLLCGSTAFGQELYKKLDGTWVSDVFTVQIDTAAGVYAGVVMGQPFERKMTFVKEMANVVIFKADDNQIVAQFQDDGSLMLTKEGGIPALVKRMPK